MRTRKNSALLGMIVYGAATLAMLWLLPWMTGVLVFALLWSVFMSGLFFGKEAAVFLGMSATRERGFYRVALFATSLFLALGIFEALLWAEQKLVRSSGEGLTIPVELKRRPAFVEGAREAFYWQGKLHVHDELGMRKSGPFPPKRPDVFRIMVVGDSQTYGSGVGTDEAFPAVLEQILSQYYNVEVLNLGIGGYQSENILWVVGTFLPRLQPDLVVYGVCLNDFLPTMVGNYDTNMAYPFPMPRFFKDFIEKRTRTGGLYARAYDRLLFKLGLRVDFYGDILRGFGGYREKFGRDVAAMNRLARARGLPPVVAMVVHQEPDVKGPPYELMLAAEEHMKNAGMKVVPASPYFARHAGKRMIVSRWEQHSSAEAHRVYAKELAAFILADPELSARLRPFQTKPD